MENKDLRDSFTDFISKIKDPRIKKNRLHRLDEILFLILCAILSGCEGWREIERFGKCKIKFLKRIYPYLHGVPSDDTIRRLLRRIHPKSFKSLFENWLKEADFEKTLRIAIDGKVSRSSINVSGDPLHVVSAYATESKLVLGQEKVSNKSNEIQAIPKLLKSMDFTHSIITIDAMGCQKKIATEILEAGADYVLALKKNHPDFYSAVEEVFTSPQKDLSSLIRTRCTKEKGHGRIEERTYRAMLCPEEILKNNPWSGLKTLIEVSRKRTEKDKTSVETHYYISSLGLKIKEMSQSIRSHWAIESNLHWVMDTAFRDDESTISKGYAGQNISIIRQVALNLLQKAKEPRGSIKQLRKACGWDHLTLTKVLSHIPSF